MNSDSWNARNQKRWWSCQQIAKKTRLWQTDDDITVQDGMVGCDQYENEYA